MSDSSVIWCPRATVATIVQHDNRFLMVEECVNGQRVLNQPAGHVDQGESIFAAAIRETLEETAWQVELEHFIGIYVLRFPDRDLTYHRYCFSARPVADRGTPLDDGILAAHWLDFEAIISGEFTLRSPLVRRCLDDYRRGRRFPLDLIFETE